MYPSEWDGESNPTRDRTAGPLSVWASATPRSRVLRGAAFDGPRSEGRNNPVPGGSRHPCLPQRTEHVQCLPHEGPVRHRVCGQQHVEIEW